MCANIQQRYSTQLSFGDWPIGRQGERMDVVLVLAKQRGVCGSCVYAEGEAGDHVDKGVDGPGGRLSKSSGKDKHKESIHKKAEGSKGDGGVSFCAKADQCSSGRPRFNEGRDRKSARQFAVPSMWTAEMVRERRKQKS